MTGTMIVLFLLYATGGGIWLRIYHWRRHGLSFADDGKPLSSAFWALTWPVTIFTHWNPELCRHREHVLRRGAMRDQLEAEEAAISRTLRHEGGR